MDSELEGGHSEGVGPHGKPLRFYVIGTAKTPKRRLEAEENGDETPDVLHDIPMPRTAVEQVFVDAGTSFDEVLTHIFPPNAGEDEDEYRERAHGEWKNFWRERAVGKHGIFSESQGLDRSNLRGNGAGEFRWDVRRQRLEEMQEHHLNPVDSLTRSRAIQRLRTVWKFLNEMNSDLRVLMLPHLPEVLHEDGFATFEDDQFLPQNWQSLAQVESEDGFVTVRAGASHGIPTGLHHNPHVPHAYVSQEFVTSIHQEPGADAYSADFVGGESWKITTLDVMSSDEEVTRFRYEFGRGPKPDLLNGQASVLPTESAKFSLPVFSDAKHYQFSQAGRVELGNLHSIAHQAWNQFKSDEAIYRGFRDGSSHVSQNIQELQKIVKALGTEPRSIWGRSIQGLFISRGLVAVELSKLVVDQDHDDLKADLKACLDGFSVTEDTLDAMLDASSSLYDESQEDDEARAFVNLYVLIDKEHRVHGLVWCQNWELTREGSVLKVRANRLYEGDEITLDSQPWLEGEEAKFNRIDEGMQHSLYIRAAGSREPQNRRLMFMLQLYALSELADRDFMGAIARLPRASEEGFAPNFASLADIVQTLGFQRAVSTAGVANFPDAQNEAEAKDLVEAAISSNEGSDAITYSAEALGVFEFLKNESTDALFGPFMIALSKVQQAGYEEALNRSKDFFRPLQPSLKKWNHWADKPEKMQEYLRSYYSARVYPTASQMMGSYVVIRELLKSPHNNMLMAGSIPMELSGGSSRKYLLNEGVQELNERDDDGRLTFLEHAAMRIPENVLWEGTLSQIHELSK